MACCYCYSCKKELDIDAKVGRSESCPFCGKDLHVCYNCLFYSPSAYNACHEPQAERVVDKDRSNFCDYFTFSNSVSVEKTGDEEKDAKEKLESLFKK